jgi:hypothetical protein
VERYPPMHVVRPFKVLRKQCRVFGDADQCQQGIAPNTRCRANKKAYVLIASIIPASLSSDINRLTL